MLVARAAERVMREQEFGGIAFIVHRGDLASRGPAAERSVRLDRQPVEGEMFGLQRERRSRSAPQSRSEAAGSAKMRSSEMFVDPGGRSVRDRLARPGPRYGSGASSEHGRIERLDAQRDPVHSGRTPRRGRLRGDVFRVGFQRDLGAGSDGLVGADAARARRDGLGAEARGRAAAEIDRLHLGRQRPTTGSDCQGSTRGAPREYASDGTSRRTAMAKSQ